MLLGWNKLTGGVKRILLQGTCELLCFEILRFFEDMYTVTLMMMWK